MTSKKSENVLLISIIIAGSAGFFIVLFLVLSKNASAFDDPIRFWFYDHRSEGLSSFVTMYTHLGDWQIISMVCLAFLIPKSTRISFGVPLSAGALGLTFLNKMIKHLVLRPRPDHIYHIIQQGGYSFPSGHSITSMFFFGMLAWLVWSNVPKTAIKIPLSLLCVFMALGIGLSRIYCGVHYPSDVLAGWCLGMAAIASEILIIRHIHSSI